MITVKDIWAARRAFVHSTNNIDSEKNLNTYNQMLLDASPEVREQYSIEFDEWCWDSEHDEEDD